MADHRPGWWNYLVSGLVVVVAAWILWSGVDVGRSFSLMIAADPVLYLGAFALFYIPFWFRSERWLLLLHRAGIKTSLRNAGESLFLSFVANNIIPAQLGDVYRAHLLGRWDEVSRSRVMGTVLVDRVLDLLFLVIAVPVTGWFVAGTLLFPSLPVSWVSMTGIVVAVVVVVGGCLRYGDLMFPRWIWQRVERMYNGLMHAVQWKDVPAIVGWTIAVWVFVGGRVYLVAESLGAGISLETAVFLAYFMILVTIMPVTPAGLGVVEVLSTGVLHILGIETAVALSIVLLDRTITYVSLVVIGSGAAALTDRSLL